MERIPDSPDEADLPAQEATPCQGAWLPRTDANGRRPPHPDRAPRSRSEAADGLTIGRGEPKPRLVMLSRPQDFAAFGGGGTTRSHPLLTARFRRTDLETTRIGLSTSRALGGAGGPQPVRRPPPPGPRGVGPPVPPRRGGLLIAPAAVRRGRHGL